MPWHYTHTHTHIERDNIFIISIDSILLCLHSYRYIDCQTECSSDAYEDAFAARKLLFYMAAFTAHHQANHRLFQFPGKSVNISYISG